MILGGLLLCGALALFLWNQYEARQAQAASQAVLPKITSAIQEAAQAREEEKTEEDTYVPLSQPVDPTMTEVEIDGRLYIGYLSIPALGLELPVQSQWDYPGLKISPCRYVGSTKTDDLVIAAHNYDRHFGRISKLSQGDLVYFTDMDGVQTTYQVMETLILQPTAIEEMTTSGYDLTLFTCTYGGKTRVTVRCDRVEE
jgi:sortase A